MNGQIYGSGAAPSVSSLYIPALIAAAFVVSLPFDYMVVNAVVTDARLERVIRQSEQRAAAREAIEAARADAGRTEAGATAETVTPVLRMERDSESGSRTRTRRAVGKWSSRLAHNQEIAGSNPARATTQCPAPAGVPVDLLEVVRDAAGREGVESHILAGLAEDESSWRPRVAGKNGELGLLQLKRDVAAWCGIKDRRDAAQSATCGARYLRTQFETFGTWTLAVVAYKAGPATIPESIPATSWAFAQRALRRSEAYRCE